MTARCRNPEWVTMNRQETSSSFHPFAPLNISVVEILLRPFLRWERPRLREAKGLARPHTARLGAVPDSHSGPSQECRRFPGTWHGCPVAPARAEGQGASGCSLPHTSPRLAAARTRSYCPPRCRRGGSRCPRFPPPPSRSWSGCRGGAPGRGPAPG